MPKMSYRSTQGGTVSKSSSRSMPSKRMVGDGTKFMSTGNAKAPLRDITVKGNNK